MAEENKEMTIEESFARLEGMVKALDSDEITLEESFKLYEEGMKLIKDVSGRIDLVEKKIRILESQGGTEDFE
ncbi:MAG TPA: exodeoxyribonuclease VII small subunit [Lachnospiraceae bacterium]|jgi:exodeoxyribonuclease VII small subunit|nr:exodeoxyribonuclease VII small subunit [Lachnospiraceae bacterium]HAV26927.1 exodeoxyribonuclease VII small subunit [Lachnospiraceae bacterium]